MPVVIYVSGQELDSRPSRVSDWTYQPIKRTEQKNMAKVLMEVESVTGEPHKPGELNAVTLVIGDDKYRLHLTDANKTKLDKALEPFIKNEKPNDPDEFPQAAAKTPQVRTGAKSDGLTPEVRMQIRRWQHMTGRTPKLVDRGRIAGADMEAWEEAGKPNPSVEEYMEWEAKQAA